MSTDSTVQPTLYEYDLNMNGQQNVVLTSDFLPDLKEFQILVRVDGQDIANNVINNVNTLTVDFSITRGTRLSQANVK